MESKQEHKEKPKQIANTKAVSPWLVSWIFEELQLVIYDDYSPFPSNLIISCFSHE